MHTFADLAEALNRPNVYLSGVQKRFALPVTDGSSYSDNYLSFLRTIVFLRTLNVSEESLLRLWNIEKKLLMLLHNDFTGSPTWFLDGWGETKNSHCRLLLTNYDLGVPIWSKEVQLCLDLVDKPSELFSGMEMGEDLTRVLMECLTLLEKIRCQIEKELPHVHASLNFGHQLVKERSNIPPNVQVARVD